jgi:hypothetical protein
MRYLCLIYLDEQELGAMPPQEASDLNARHWAVNDQMKRTRNFRAAEALGPAASTKTIRVRNGKLLVRDGPFAEAKEMVAGFYFLEAKTLEEATELAARIPSAAIGSIEVRPCRMLDVIDTPSHWGDDTTDVDAPA